MQIMRMCAALAANGAQVNLVSKLPSENAFTAASLYAHHGIAANFEIQQQALPSGPRPTDLFQLRAVWQNRKRPNWLCYARGRDLTAPLFASLLGHPVVVEQHGRLVSQREVLYMRQMQRSGRAWFVVPSTALKQLYIAEYGLQDENWIVVPGGATLSAFAPPLSKSAARTAVGLPVEGRYALYVGGLYEGRGLEAIFAAMRNQAAKLVIVGGRDADDIAHWRQVATNSGLDNVYFAGLQPPVLVPTWLQTADVLLMPYSQQTRIGSGEDTTAFMSPIKMFEYLAAGRPIITSDLPILHEVLTHQQNALMIPPDEVAPLASAINTVLTDDTLAAQLAKHAAHSAQSYSWDARAHKILQTVTNSIPL